MFEDNSSLLVEKADKKEPRVSFIVATLNRADCLDKLLMNAREFLTDEDEFIIMDGGSSDHTCEIIKKHKDIITIFESEKDFSSTHALNKAILKSRGRILVNLNDDDYFYADGIKKAIEVMEENPDLDALVCGGEYYSKDPVSGEMKLGGYQYLPESEVLVSDVKHILEQVSAGFLFLRRRVIAHVGLFDSRMQSSDADYMSRLILCKKNFKYLNIKMFRAYIRTTSATMVNWQQACRDSITIAMRHGEWDAIMKNPLTEICAAFKLNDYPLCDWMLDLIWFKYHTRKYKKMNALFLTSYLFIIHVLHLIAKQINKFFIWSKKKPVFSKKNSPSEPQWDGFLR